jgi:hypothetical protein
MGRRISIIVLSVLVAAGISLEVYGAKRLWDLIHAPPPPDLRHVIPVQVSAERSSNLNTLRNILTRQDFRPLRTSCTPPQQRTT